MGLTLASLFWIPKLFEAKTRRTLKARLGWGVENLSSSADMRIWVHAVSVGETKSVVPLIKKLKQENPEAFIIFSTITETGLQEAKNSFPEADRHLLLPLDLVVRKFVKEAKPTMVILAETDFWFHFLDEAKNQGAKIVLVNGKVSSKSQSFYRFIPQLLSRVDRFIVQNDLYQSRFLELGIPSDKIVVGGNLKIDAEIPDQTYIYNKDPVLVIGSTHDPEEKMFLFALKELWIDFPRLKVYIVPRHPERFDAVARLIESFGMSYGRFSKGEESSRLVLVDQMGHLKNLYQKADLCAVAGSWTAKVGGHNILEPGFYGKPVIFGPFMHTQTEFAEQVINAEAGVQVEESNLTSTIDFLIQNPAQARTMGHNGLSLIKANRGSLEKTFTNLLC